MIWINLKKRTSKEDWYDMLINYIPEPIEETVGGVKDQIISLFIVNQNESKLCTKLCNQANLKYKNNLKTT